MNPAPLSPACYDLTQHLSAEQLDLLLANALLRGALDAGPAPNPSPAPNLQKEPDAAAGPARLLLPAPARDLARDPALALALDSPRCREENPEPLAAAALLRDSNRELALRLRRQEGWPLPPPPTPGSPLALCLAELSSELQAGRLNAISAILSAYQFGRAAALRRPPA